MRRLASVLSTASILFGSFCPMAIASAMQLSQPTEDLSQSEEVLMSPYMPMTLAAPMSVAPVVSHQLRQVTQALSSCSGGNCIRIDSQKQEIAVSVSNGDIRGGAALPALIRSIAGLLSMPTPPRMQMGSSLLANITTTIVLRV